MVSQIKQVSLENVSWVDIYDTEYDEGTDTAEVDYTSIPSQDVSEAGVSALYENAVTTLGALAGWRIGDQYLKIGEGSEQVGLSGEATAANDVRIWAGSSVPTSAAFRVYESGALVATSATITGSITATSGSIGGFDIGSTYIRDAADSFGLASYVSGSDDVRFWAGDTYANRSTAPFYVTESGVIYAESGTIGGWTLSSTTLVSTGSNLTLDGANEQILVGAGITLAGTTQRITVGSASPNILIDGSAKTIGTDLFLSGATGWRIDYDGSAEFNDIVARGEFRTAVFVMDEVHATGGSLLINTASTLKANATTVTTPSTSTMDIEDPPSGHAQVFAVNDILRIKDGSGLDNWLKVTAVSDQTTFYRYTVQKQSGTNGTFYTGTAVVKYGISTEGGILLTSDMSNSPYIDIFLNGATPWSGIDVKARLGWLYGITDTEVGLSATDVWGLYSDSVYLKGTIVASSGAIGGFNIESEYINDTADSFGLSSTVSGGDDVRFWAGDTYANRAIADFRVTEAGVVTATSGTIGGWTLSATTLVGGSLTLDAANETFLVGSATAPLTGDGVFIGKDGSDYEFRAGNPDGEYVHYTGSGLTVKCTLTASQIEGGNFTVGIPSLAFNVAQNILPIQLSLSSTGNMVASFAIDTGGNGNLTLIRMDKVAGQYIPIEEIGGTYSRTFDFAIGVTNIHGCAYHNGEYYWSSGTTSLRKGNGAATAMTFTSNADAGLLATTDTYLYILDDSDDVTVRKYSTSGTTATWVSNITLDAASPDGFYCDGVASFWGRNGNVIREYNSSGVTQQTITLSATPANLISGVFVDGGNVYVAYLGYWGEFVSSVSRLRASSVTFLPVATA